MVVGEEVKTIIGEGVGTDENLFTLRCIKTTLINVSTYTLDLTHLVSGRDPKNYHFNPSFSIERGK